MKTKNKHNNLHLFRLLHDNIPQKYIAGRLGISQVSYCKLERGDVMISEAILDRLTEFYQFQVRDFIFIPAEDVKKRFLNTQTFYHSTEPLQEEG